jgi:hypothetical protein
MRARLKLVAWLAGFAGFCAWLLCGYCGPHPFLTMHHGPMPPDYVAVLTAGSVFTANAIIAVFVRSPAEATNAQQDASADSLHSKATRVAVRERLTPR